MLQYQNLNFSPTKHALRRVLLDWEPAPLSKAELGDLGKNELKT